jgi:hypothetical protein
MNTFGRDRAVLLRGRCRAHELNVSETDNILTPDSGSSRTVAKFMGNQTAEQEAKRLQELVLSVLRSSPM